MNGQLGGKALRKRPGVGLFLFQVSVHHGLTPFSSINTYYPIVRHNQYERNRQCKPCHRVSFFILSIKYTHYGKKSKALSGFNRGKTEKMMLTEQRLIDTGSSGGRRKNTSGKRKHIHESSGELERKEKEAYLSSTEQ